MESTSENSDHEAVTNSIPDTLRQGTGTVGVLSLFDSVDTVPSHVDSGVSAGCVKKMPKQICLNPDCGAKINLQVAPYFVCAYFGVVSEKFGRRRVCRKCYKDAENHQNVLVKMLCDHQSIMLGPKKPRHQLVTIDDEDNEDPQSQTVECPEEVEVEGDLKQIINQVTEKYKFGDQVKASVKFLGKYYVSFKKIMYQHLT